MGHTGVRSSEFWVIIVSGLIATIGKAFNLSQDIIDGVIKLALAYLGGRSAVKIGEAVANHKK